MKDIRERQLTAYNDDISSSTFMRYDEDNEGEGNNLEFTHKHNSMNNTSKKEGRESSKRRKHHKNRKMKPYQTMITN